MKVVALGDCNTLGVGSLYRQTYVECFATMIGAEVENRGTTMSTTREMLEHLKRTELHQGDVILVQYGLVDSWKTFKYAPYVLYYPDHFLRKIGRKVVKKYKKIARKYGWNKRFGEENVVPIDRYKENLSTLLSSTEGMHVFLIDTVPNSDIRRNDAIKRYNALLKEVAQCYAHAVHIPLYDTFEGRYDALYLEGTHLNEIGYEMIAEQIYKAYKERA